MTFELFVMTIKVGTKRVLELAKGMGNLRAFIHLSTAFCHVDQEELREVIYDTDENPNDVIKLVEWLKEDALNLITPK